MKTIGTQVSTVVHAPPEAVYETYADHSNWPRIFPTIRAVRLIRRDRTRVVLEIDHVESKVVNELVLHPLDRIDLREVKRRYDVWFVNRFEAASGGTRFTVIGEVRLKGWARVVGPVLRWYVRRQMRRLQLQPVKAETEQRTRMGLERRAVP
jgi:hypothetical protein